jgi:hypothetical protein
MKPTDHQMQSFRRSLHEATVLGHAADLTRARVARDVMRITGCEGKPGDDAWIVLRDGLEQGRRTAGLLKLGRALLEVPNEKLWRAIGWDGVRSYVLPLKGARRREAITKLLADFEATRKRLAPKRIRALAGGAPKPPTQRRRPGSTARPAENNPAQQAHARLCEKALDNLVRLAAFNPSILPLLDADVRAAVQARASEPAPLAAATS